MRNYRVTLFILGLGLISIPASATIAYTTYCSSGCDNTGGDFAAWQTTGGPGLIYSISPITFVSGGLTAGVYTDTGTGTAGTGTVFTNYTSGGGVDPSTAIANNYLIQSASGTNTGFEIDLPANTYAFAMMLTGCSSTCGSFIANFFATVGVGTDAAHPDQNYSMVLNTGSTNQFFGIVSDAPITSLFLQSGNNTSYLGISSFELGDTPEPSTVVTVGLGITGLYFWYRRRRRA